MGSSVAHVIAEASVISCGNESECTEPGQRASADMGDRGGSVCLSVDGLCTCPQFLCCLHFLLWCLETLACTCAMPVLLMFLQVAVFIYLMWKFVPDGQAKNEQTNYLKWLTSWLASNATLNLHFVSACKISLTKLTAVLYISTLDSDQANNATFIHSHTSHEETSCNISEIAVFICYWNKIQIKPEMRKYWHMSTVSRSYHNYKPHIIYDDFKAEILRKLFCGWVKVMCKCTREGWPWVMRLALFSCQHLVLNITQSSYLVADLCCQFIIIIL